MGKVFQSVGVLLFVVGLAAAQQPSVGDEGGSMRALENAWKHALEAKDTKALDMLLANTFVSVDIDGSISSKSEFLASIKSPSDQPSQAVTEQSSVQVYGDVAVVVGAFRIRVRRRQEYGERADRTSTAKDSSILDQVQGHTAVCSDNEHTHSGEIRECNLTTPRPWSTARTMKFPGNRWGQFAGTGWGERDVYHLRERLEQSVWVASPE
jgi:ketosteroid isomerase-like protein